MELVEIQLQPGFFTEQTDRGAKGRWRDGDKVRFRYGLPEKLKGWVNYENLIVQPPVRRLHDWSSLDNQQWLAIASDKKLYLINNDILYDITPLEASGNLANPFATTLDSPDVVVSHVLHGVDPGQVVRFSGATAVGGLTLNGTFEVKDLIDLDNYVITAASNATSTATGGGSVNYEYEIEPPFGTTQSLGYGIGPYGTDDDPNYVGTGYGTPRVASNLRTETPLWSLDNWGQDLMACRRGGPIYVWERAKGPTTRARIIPNAPIANNWIIVSPEDRHLISVGSHDGIQRDQALIRWCSQENYDDWTPSESNTAGDKRLDSGSRCISARRTRGETIIWTDSSLYSMSFEGGQTVFGFQPKGESLSMVSPNASVEAGGIIYFMARDEFVAYDGVTRILPCSVRNYVFDDINRSIIDRVYAAVNKEQSEVWWFYPSATASENDRYVIFNYRESAWYYGQMPRTAYADSGFLEVPIAVDPQGRIYKQETGVTADGLAMPSRLESYDQEISDIGDRFAHVSRFIPDFLALTGDVQMTFRTRVYPTAAAIEKGPYTVSPTTRRVNFRARGRQIGIILEDTGTGQNWRMGTLRVEVVVDGGR